MTDVQTVMLDGAFLVGLLVFVLTWIDSQVRKWR